MWFSFNFETGVLMTDFEKTSHQVSGCFSGGLSRFVFVIAWSFSSLSSESTWKILFFQQEDCWFPDALG